MINGTLLYQSDAISFVPGMSLKLFVNATSVSLVYGATTNWTGSHGLDFDTWPDGAVGVVEAEDPTGSRTWYVEMDNFKAWRPDAAKDELFAEDFSQYPDGIAIRAEPEYGNIRRWTVNYAESFVTNGSLHWIPERVSEGGSWYNPRRNYHNDARFSLGESDVVEVQTAYSAFSNGVARTGIIPECFPGDLYYQYKAPALYLQTSNNLQGQAIFELYRHHGPWGDRVLIGRNTQYAYVDGQTITLQVSTNACRIWYGTNVVVNQSDGNGTIWLHGVTNAVQIYADGVFPHLEFLNQANQNNAAVRLDKLVLRQRAEFISP